MNDKRNSQIEKIVQIVHNKVEEKSKRFLRLSNDLILENMVLRLLAEDSSRSPKNCRDILRENCYMDCSMEDILRVFRDYKINSIEKRKNVLGTVADMVSLMDKAMQGDAKSLLSFKDAFKTMISDDKVRCSRRYSNLILAFLYQKITVLAIGNDKEEILNFGSTVAKYLIWDIVDAVKSVYKSSGNKRENKRKVINIEEYERALGRMEELERAWQQTDMLLNDLQKEFDERIEAAKLQEMTEFFGKLNSEKYGYILDELLVLRKGMEVIRQNGYELPLEINGLLIMVKKLIQFVRDNHINPMVRPDSVQNVRVSDVEFWDYEGSPFMNVEEEKTVKVISPGWIYSDKDVQISRPKVKEV